MHKQVFQLILHLHNKEIHNVSASFLTKTTSTLQRAIQQLQQNNFLTFGPINFQAKNNTQIGWRFKDGVFKTFKIDISKNNLELESHKMNFSTVTYDFLKFSYSFRFFFENLLISAFFFKFQRNIYKLKACNNNSCILIFYQ